MKRFCTRFLFLFLINFQISAYAKETGKYQLSSSGENYAACLADTAMFYHFAGKNNFEKAAEHLLKAIERNKNSIYLAAIALETCRAGKIPEEKVVEFVKKHPDATFLCFLISDYLSSNGKEKEGGELLQSGITYRLENPATIPEDSEERIQALQEIQTLFNGYLRSLLVQNKFPEADAFLEQWDLRYPQELLIESLLNRIEYFLTAREKFPENNRIYEKKYLEHRDLLQKLLEQTIEFNMPVTEELIKLLDKEGELSLLESLLGEGLISNPVNTASYQNLGMLYRIKNYPVPQYQADLQTLLIQTAINKKIPATRLPYLMYLAVKTENTKNVKEILHLAGKNKALSDELLFHAGEFFLQKGDLSLAEFCIGKISNNQMKNIILAFLLRQQKKYREAMTLFMEIERNAPDFTAYKLLAAEMAGKAGEKEIEEQYNNEMLLKSDQNHEFQNYLGYTWAEKGIRLDQAETLVRSAVAADPENYSYLDSLAWVLYKRKKYQDAMEYILKAIELCDSEITRGVLYDHAGDIFLALGDLEKAQTFWQKALQTEDQELDREAVRKKLPAITEEILQAEPEKPDRNITEADAIPEAQNQESGEDDRKNGHPEPEMTPLSHSGNKE